MIELRTGLSLPYKSNVTGGPHFPTSARTLASTGRENSYAPHKKGDTISTNLSGERVMSIEQAREKEVHGCTPSPRPFDSRALTAKRSAAGVPPRAQPRCVAISRQQTIGTENLRVAIERTLCNPIIAKMMGACQS